MLLHMDSKQCYKCKKPGHIARQCNLVLDSGDANSSAPRGRYFNNNTSSYNRNFQSNDFCSSGDNKDFGVFYGGDLTHSNQHQPFNKRGSGSSRCFRCNKSGHLARDCMETAERCYRCNKAGHLAKDCENEVQSGSCYNCGLVGHLQRECPKQTSKSCYKCKETGHLAKDCPESESDDDRTCYNCGKPGHISRDCPESSQRTISKLQIIIFISCTFFNQAFIILS